MNNGRRHILVGALAGLLWGCGDKPSATVDGGVDAPTRPDAAPPCLDSFEVCLAAAPGVASVESVNDVTGQYLHVGFVQPIDHEQPNSETFIQYANLVVSDRLAPTVLLTSGYYEFYRGYLDQLTLSLDANQVALEHRFFGDSVPSATDWSTLTVKQAADDQHRIVQILKPLLAGAWISTGTSKGGMTASYHRRFYPDDVDGTVPVSAPMSFAFPDPRYDNFLENIGGSACRTKLVATLAAMLDTHRAEFISRTQLQADGIGHFATYTAAQSLQDAVKWLYWGLWQTGFNCNDVPAANAGVEVLWDFLNEYAYPAYFVDENRGLGSELDAYNWQASVELGMQDFALEALSEFMVAPIGAGESLQWATSFPSTPPAHSRATMDDVANWLATSGSKFAFLYGRWDPWAGAEYELGGASDSVKLWVEGAPHNFAFEELSASDLSVLFAKLEAWTGHTPHLPNAALARRTREHVARELATITAKLTHARRGPPVP